MTEDQIKNLPTPWTDDMEIEIQGDYVVYADEVRAIEKECSALLAALKDCCVVLVAAEAGAVKSEILADEMISAYQRARETLEAVK